MYTTRQKEQVHAYGAISYYGQSQLYFVSGTKGVKKQMFWGNGPGVNSMEYTHMLKHDLLPSVR